MSLPGLRAIRWARTSSNSASGAISASSFTSDSNRQSKRFAAYLFRRVMAMGEIKYFSKVDFSDRRSLQRVLAVAKADAGLWLMPKKREMERQALAAASTARATGKSAVDSHVPERPTRSVADLAAQLVWRMFGMCSGATLEDIHEAML
jgi:hypothetical protein